MTLETSYKRLNDIYISPNFEGVLYTENGEVKGAIFGIGSKLLNALEERLRELGVTTILLFTSKGNKTSNFYQKNDFSVWDSMAMMGKDI